MPALRTIVQRGKARRVPSIRWVPGALPDGTLKRIRSRHV